MAKPVFVYGTLRMGQSNHHIIESQLLSAVPAVIRGALYHLPQQGYPAVVLDGTGLVYGELMDFYDFERALVDMDKLEGYEGSNRDDNLYDRVTTSAIVLRDRVNLSFSPDEMGKSSESFEKGLAYSKHHLEMQEGMQEQTRSDTFEQDCYIYVFSPRRIPWLKENATKVEGGDWVEFIGERREGQVDEEKSQERS